MIIYFENKKQTNDKRYIVCTVSNRNLIKKQERAREVEVSIYKVKSIFSTIVNHSVQTPALYLKWPTRNIDVAFVCNDVRRRDLIVHGEKLKYVY